MPAVPDGFTVELYAEIEAPRMMVYAPNGDLFVTSSAIHTITVLRDRNQDGVFETRSSTTAISMSAIPARSCATSTRRET
jgi:hypothetical protein